MKKNTYTIPLALVFCLFFLWAISSNLLPTMIRQLMKTCELNTFEASFTETAYWLAYFIFPIPIAMFMKRYSYKAGIIFGLLLAALGGLLFFPAAMLKAYWAYLCIFFIIATGMCFLETAANPYVTVLGAPETAPRRLNLAQSFNGLGAFISAMFLSKLILSGTHYTRDTLPVDYPGGWQAYIQVETDAMKFPYLMLALLLVIIAVVFIFSKLPQIGDESKTPSSGSKKEKLIDFGVLKHSHLRWGVIAQFFYNGGQTAINSLFLVYCCSYAGLPEETATTFFGLYMLAFLVGRWIGTGLMVKFRPQDMLLVYSLMNILLCGVVMIWGGMVSKQSANPKADRMDRQSCSWVAEQIIQVSIKNGFRTQSDWDRYFSMNDAIEKGNIGEWALQSVINENGGNGDMVNDTTNTLTDTDSDATSKIHRTAGKKKILERPLIDYLDCNNKEEVLGHIRNFISINTSAVHQALPFYVLKDLRLVAGMHTAKEYSVGLALQFPDLPSLKSESAIRQSVGFLKTAKYVIKEGKDQLAPLIESDENQELYQKLVQTITDITASNTTDIGAK